MTTDQLINVLVTITLVEMMAAIGLSVSLAELAGALRNVGLLARAGLANYVCVPAVTVALLLLLGPSPLVVAGFLILAVCPGAPFAPACVRLAGGHVPTSIGSMVVLAASSALLAPLLLRLLLPLLASEGTPEVDVGKMLTALLVTQLLPLCVGLGVRQWLPQLAARLQRPANLLSTGLSLLAFAVILLAQGHVLAEVRLRGYFGMAALLLASLAAGWLLGGPGGDGRKALALTTSLRNVGVALAIASGSFARTQAVAAVVAYGIFEIVGSLLVALAWGRQAPAKGAAVGGVAP